MKISVSCAFCGKSFDAENGSVNRAKKKNASLYCNRTCAGMGRRKNKTPEQKKEDKRLYDINYRATSPTLKARKAAYYQRTRNPEKEREVRKARMHLHIKYCQRPAYREWKKKYDRNYRCKKMFGEFGDAASILFDIENEVSDRITRYEISQQNGTLNKHQQRRRDYDNTISNRT